MTPVGVCITRRYNCRIVWRFDPLVYRSLLCGMEVLVLRPRWIGSSDSIRVALFFAGILTMVPAPEDRLDLERIVSETFLSDGEYHPVIDSTNNRGKVLALSNGVPFPYLVLAEEQTAGRGRALKRWWTGRGSLAFSIILPLTREGPRGGTPEKTVATPSSPMAPLLPEESIRFLGLAGALAVCRAAVRHLSSGVSLGIHWPNDVYAGSAKLAGVLVEVTGNRRAIVGVGVNVNNRKEDAPPELQRHVATLMELCGQPLDRTALLIEVVGEFQRLFETLMTHPGDLIEEANRVCLQKGRELVLETEGGLVAGRCRGIDPTGALILETTAGERRFLSGTVVAVE